LNRRESTILLVAGMAKALSLQKRKPRKRRPPPLLFTNIRQLLTLRGPAGPRRGLDLRELGVIEDAAVLCAGGRIVSVGSRTQARRDAWFNRHGQRVQTIDCQGGVMLPGFVDGHTHPAFMAPRLLDFERRTAGAAYEEIAAGGGGILSSVSAVQYATPSELAKTIRERLEQMAAHGTTTVEAKSGYGLSVEAEIKSLKSIGAAASRWPGTVVSTLLAAHALPEEFTRPGKSRGNYLRLIVEELIPQTSRNRLARFVDAFCDSGAFSMAETKRVFAAARQHRLGVRAHVSQLIHTPLAELVALFHPASVDHLDHLASRDIKALKNSDTIATLVPGANYFLGLGHYPPARKLIDGGAAVALATDYNPGTSPTLSIPMALSISCTQMGMTAGEAIAAATINGAWSLQVAEQKGSIEPWKDADLALFAVQDYREIPYWFGVNLCMGTCLRGHWITRDSNRAFELTEAARAATPSPEQIYV